MSQPSSLKGGQFAARPLMLLIVLLALVLVGALIVQETRPTAEPVSNDEQEHLCENPPAHEQCSTVLLEGREWRYSLYKSISETRQTIIFDPGGPGVSVLNGELQLATTQQNLFNRFNLLVVEEPWVTAEISPECETSLSSYYQSLREGENISSAAEFLRSSCEIGSSRYGFSSETYSNVIQAISSENDITITGFVGHSFGAVRLGYLQAGPVQNHPDWAVLTRPFPVGANLDEIESARYQLLDSVPAVPADWMDVQLEGRSLPVTAFDALTARIASGYVPEEQLSAVYLAIEEQTDAELIAQLSDSFWQRYGVNSVSPGMLAYWDEYCSIAGREDAEISKPNSTDILRMNSYPCLKSQTAIDLNNQATSICVAGSMRDTVTPHQLALDHIKPNYVIEVTERGHENMSGWRECLQELEVVSLCNKYNLCSYFARYNCSFYVYYKEGGD